MRKKYLTETIAFAAFIVCMSLFVARCKSAGVAAETAYGVELQNCVQQTSSLADSKACRAAVDAKWGVDGGSDGH